MRRWRQEDADAFRRRALLAALDYFYCPVEAGDLDAYLAVFAPGTQPTVIALVLQQERESRR
ncbi:MAG TPA: hypothetical protein VH561_21000 [Micromonosporaceae bacterium]